MADEWVRYCHTRDFAVIGSRIRVTLVGGRGHDVSVDEDEDSYRLSAVVVGKAVAESMPDLSLRAWTCNRVMELVGFQLDAKSRLVGTCWVPKPGLTAKEFRLYVRTLAIECDAYEYRLTGKDRA